MMNMRNGVEQAATASTEDLADSNFIMPIRRRPAPLRLDNEEQGIARSARMFSSAVDLLEDSDGESWEAIPRPHITDDKQMHLGDRSQQPVTPLTPESSRQEYLGFWDAVCRGDCEVVSSMLCRNMSVWQSDEGGRTPLVMAITAGLEEMMILLLDQGANVHQPVDRMAPIMHAISKKHDAPRLMNLLLDYGASLHVIAPPDKLNTLHFAALRGVIDAVDFLVSKNLNLEQEDFRGRTALMIAAENGHLTTVKVLIAKGADMRSRSRNGRTAMMWAASNGHVDVVSYFLEQGIGTDDVDNSGLTTLSILSWFGSMDGVKLMLANGADVNGDSEEPRYFTPVMIAATENHLEVMKVLMDHDANLALTERRGDTALDIQIAMGCPDSTRILLKTMGGSNYPLNSVALQIALASTSQGTSTAIMDTAKTMYAEFPASVASNTSYSWIQWILEQGGNIVKPYAMRNMMKTAISNQQSDVVQELCSLGFNPDQYIGGGHTALTLAIHHKSLDLVQSLLNAGADPACLAFSEGLDEMTPLFHAVVALDNDPDMDTSIVDALLATGRCKLMKGPSLRQNAFYHVLSRYRDWNHNVAEILTFRMLKTTSDVHTDRSDDGASLTHAAVLNNCKELVDIILDMGADINTRDKYGCTPFFAGMPMPTFNPDNTDLLRFLIEKGADPLAIAKDGQTALHINVSFPANPPVIKFLLDAGLDINKPKNSGESALGWAVKHNREETALLLFQHGAQVLPNRFDGGGNLLHSVVARGMSTVLSRVLQANVINVNAMDDKGCTPLLRAFKRDQRQDEEVLYNVVKQLLDAGADIQHATRFQDQALHLALLGCHESVAKLLLQRGANMCAVGYEGGTPLHLAVERRCHTITQKLLLSGVDMEARDEIGQTPLFFADHKTSAEALINYGADVNVVDKHGWTALHAAVKALNAPVFEVLLNAGADLEIKTPDDGMTVRDRIMALVGENWRCAFFKVITECQRVREQIDKHESEFMETSWRKWVQIDPRTGVQEFRMPKAFVSDKQEESQYRVA